MAKAELKIGADGVPMAWTIPADRSKNGRAHFVPLSPMALELITEAIQLSGKSPYVFRARHDTGNHVRAHAITVAMDNLGRALPEDEIGVDTWRRDMPTPHDLRRTCATRLSAAGVRTEDVAAVLNHTRRDVTGRHYDRHDRAAEKRAALDRWSAILAGILEPRPANNVVALRG
jgi:integrase